MKKKASRSTPAKAEALLKLRDEQLAAIGQTVIDQVSRGDAPVSDGRYNVTITAAQYRQFTSTAQAAGLVGDTAE